MVSKNEYISYFKAHEKEMIADLFTLARIPSIVSEREGDAPFGRPCAEALEAARALFEREGFDTEMAADGSYALVYYGGRDIGKSVGLFAHTDVVPVGDDWVYTKPFEPILKDGCAIGRGVEDNKAGVIMSLWCLRYFKEKGIAPHRPITVFLGSCEETGMEDIAAFRKEREMPYVSLVPDGGYPFAYGENGIARFYFTAKTPFAAITDLSGGDALNVVLDRAIAHLDDERLVEEIKTVTAENGNVTVNGSAVIAKGVAAHASTPDGSVNAARELALALAACPSLPDGDRAILKNMAHLLSDTDGTVLGIKKADPHFTPLTVANGVVKCEDGKLSFSLDIRYGTAIDSEEMVRTLAATAEEYEFTLKTVENKAGFLLPLGSPFDKAILDVCERHSGERPTPFLMGGGTYARYLTNAYSMATSVPYVTDPYVCPAPGHGGAHQADEHLPIDAFLEAAALFTDIVLAFCKL
ncbi:MAG: Sapep family Mn(2+)-dependent dipeptidase [Clostridia bacterium]|nr:Sapep family Mn(2+)-dependent dipeptidase [Clostridia bacterium]